ncbi:hypothetical protein CPLU01_06073 [Colletotrichum plurivorum]|uniref:F-box domain-containing protein n=1 Tax=Colletotrichum plurivorum TaxID=2175906 RepID=A0A8H6KJF3_9PEZI|nr:hypothetical protein CPLU01_06073 [Colletotrichum plurivorum]
MLGLNLSLEQLFSKDPTFPPALRRCSAGAPPAHLTLVPSSNTNLDRQSHIMRPYHAVLATIALSCNPSITSMEDPIDSEVYAISRLQVASHPITIDGTPPLNPAEVSVEPSDKPQTTSSPTPAQEPAPTLETLPTELLRSVADHLSAPQRSLLALASKQTLFKLGLPSREEWQEISNSPFLPSFLGLHDARTFAPRLHGTFNISSSRFVAAPDDLSCNVDCFSRCTTWNGNLILKTTLNYTLSDDPDKMSKLVQLFQEDRTQEGGPAGG